MASMLMGGLAPSGLKIEDFEALFLIKFDRPKTFKLIDGTNIKFDTFYDLMRTLSLNYTTTVNVLYDFFITSYEYGLTPSPATQLRYAQARANIIALGENTVKFADKFIRWVRGGNKFMQQAQAIHGEKTLLGTLKAAAAFSPGFQVTAGDLITPYTKSMLLQDAAWNRSDLTRLRAIANAQKRANALDFTQRVQPDLRFGAPTKADWADSSLLITKPTVKRRKGPKPETILKAMATRQARERATLSKLRDSAFYGPIAVRKTPRTYEDLLRIRRLEQEERYRKRLEALRKLDTDALEAEAAEIVAQRAREDEQAAAAAAQLP